MNDVNTNGYHLSLRLSSFSRIFSSAASLGKLAAEGIFPGYLVIEESDPIMLGNIKNNQINLGEANKKGLDVQRKMVNCIAYLLSTITIDRSSQLANLHVMQKQTFEILVEDFLFHWIASDCHQSIVERSTDLQNC